MNKIIASVLLSLLSTSNVFAATYFKQVTLTCHDLNPAGAKAHIVGTLTMQKPNFRVFLTDGDVKQLSTDYIQVDGGVATMSFLGAREKASNVQIASLQEELTKTSYIAKSDANAWQLNVNRGADGHFLGTLTIPGYSQPFSIECTSRLISENVQD